MSITRKQLSFSYDGDQGIAQASNWAEIRRLSEVGESLMFDSKRGADWEATRTGFDRNDLNGVICEPGFFPSSGLMKELGTWFGEAPATWHLAESNSEFPKVARESEWDPEESARCAGRYLPFDLQIEIPAGCRIELVHSHAGIEDWLDVAQLCGWFDAEERERRRPLIQNIRWSRWVAYFDEQPVGMATGWFSGEVGELVDIAVLPAFQRKGIGRALVADVANWLANQTILVSSPSPDGWQLLKTLGFRNVPCLPNVSAYWPGTSAIASE